MGTTLQNRKRRGVPAGGQFVAVPAPEGGIELSSATTTGESFPNTLEGILARREQGIRNYRVRNFGAICESSGQLVQEQWNHGQRIIRHRSTRRGFVQGTYRCGRCGDRVLVEARWSAGRQRTSYSWVFTEHLVPAP